MNLIFWQNCLPQMKKAKINKKLFEKMNALAVISNPTRFKILLALFISDVLEKNKKWQKKLKNGNKSNL